MKFPIIALSVVLSITSISVPVGAIPTDVGSSHLVERAGSGPYLQEFIVWYGSSASEEPSDSVKEINGQSGDINKGFGGNYVWLKINRTDNNAFERSIYDFYFRSSDCAIMYLLRITADLAKGAGGNCRYLVYAKNEASRHGVNAYPQPALTDAGLWRAPGATTTPPPGWKFISADLNVGRGGDYLYIVTR